MDVLNPLTSFLSGILAAFTPCAAVLIPVVAYRFVRKEINKLKTIYNYLFFIAGFVSVFLISAKFLSAILNSSLKNGFQLGLGILFITLGILEILNKINPLSIPFIKNSFIFGSIFAVLMSFNPCTLPYLGIIVSLTKPYYIILNMLFFSIGLITPSIMFSVFGSELIHNISKKSGKLLNNITKVMSIILLLSGFYLMISIKSFGIYDTYIASVMIFITFWILLKSLYIIDNLKSLKNPENILLLITLILIIVSLIYHCNHISETLSLNTSQQTCSINTECEVCTRCIYIFSGSVILGFIAIFGKFYYKIKNINNNR